MLFRTLCLAHAVPAPERPFPTLLPQLSTSLATVFLLLQAHCEPHWEASLGLTPFLQSARLRYTFFLFPLRCSHDCNAGHPLNRHYCRPRLSSPLSSLRKALTSFSLSSSLWFAESTIHNVVYVNSASWSSMRSSHSYTGWPYRVQGLAHVRCSIKLLA